MRCLISEHDSVKKIPIEENIKKDSQVKEHPNQNLIKNIRKVELGKGVKDEPYQPDPGSKISSSLFHTGLNWL